MPVAEAKRGPGRPQTVFYPEGREWIHTHTIGGVPVMRLPGAPVGPSGRLQKYPTFWDKDHNRVHPYQGRKAIPVEVGIPVDPIEEARREGWKACMERYGLVEEGQSRLEEADPSVQIEEKFKVFPLVAAPDGTMKRRFKTIQVAPALAAIMGSQDGGQWWVLSPTMHEGEFREKLEDGSLIVTARIYDWRVKSHHIFRLKVPPEMDFEVVE